MKKSTNFSTAVTSIPILSLRAYGSLGNNRDRGTFTFALAFRTKSVTISSLHSDHSSPLAFFIAEHLGQVQNSSRGKPMQYICTPVAPASEAASIDLYTRF